MTAENSRSGDDMQVVSPVGQFRVVVDGVRIRDGRPVIRMSMGAWRSEATLERGDLGYVGFAAGLLAAAFYVGRRSVKTALGACEGSAR